MTTGVKRFHHPEKKGSQGHHHGGGTHTEHDAGAAQGHEHEHVHDDGTCHAHTHEHEKGREHIHEHSHEHGHDHDHDVETRTLELAPMEKLEKMIAYFAAHSAEHAQTYHEWAEKARQMGKGDVAELMEKASEKTHKATKIFRKAEKLLP